MFIYKIKEVKICVLLREHPDVPFAEIDAAAYKPCLGPNRKLILIALLLKFSKAYLKIMYIQNIEKQTFLQKIPSVGVGTFVIGQCQISSFFS